MKVVILCGGKGTRFREETEFKPKPLVNVGDMPLLWHLMKTYAHFGYKDFILCLGYKGEMIKDYFLHFEEWTNNFTLRLRHNEKVIHHDPLKLEDWNISFIDTGQESNTGSRVFKIRDYIGDDEDFFLNYGDGLSDVDIPATYKFHKEKGKAITITTIKPRNIYGVLTIDGDQACGFEEKPPMSNWINGGFFVCNKRVFDYLKPDPNCILEKEFSRMIDEGQMAAYQHNGFWNSINTHKDWEEFNRMEREGNTPWKIWQKN
jgi:glucose-1-phosphate cytidylyltransferase